MNNDEFLKRLSEVAEWYRPQTGPQGQPSVSKGRAKPIPEHPGAITEAELDEMTEEAVTEYYEQLIAWREAQPNASVPPEILRLRPYARKCEDCNKACDSTRRVECKQYVTVVRHWREYCNYCERFRDPRTGEFSVKREASAQFFGNLYRRDKPMPKAKVPKEPKEKRPLGRPKKLTRSQIVEQIIAQGTWVTHETETAVIRQFVPKTQGLE
jgi:hypothetical protein